ncbi:MAG: thioredoxin domain-containing protein [Chlorobiaceae bacterium]|nr:thioredoxin domain-containing protein [Chlorobiaceae bacterium]
MPKLQQPNRLIHEKSPYLLQHAWNPVDWYPWGEEAFEKARQKGCPIFLSIGYSTCHWCHVMERESFEDERTAAILNSRFVPVKVDREEMPDLDHLYMLFVQATTGSGGWPMSVWLTPSLKPFYGGSYFPPVERWGRPSFKEILESLADMWKNDQQRLIDSSGSIMRQLPTLTHRPESNTGLNHTLSDRCQEDLERSFDPVHGGFGGAPKFPRPSVLRFLFSQASRTGDSNALRMALLTLRKMSDGGIHDHLGLAGRGGGGFSRYSTDEFWHVPHFEKMLYDNAQLADVYLKAWQWTHEPFFADAARDIFNYVRGDMTHPDGGFFAAEDADSLPAEGIGELREGAFYLWTETEIIQLLGKHDGELFCKAYGVSSEGNAPHDPHGEFAGQNILLRAGQTESLAKAEGVTPQEVERRLEAARTKLFEARARRPRPRRDGKVITAWNGLMISAFARGAVILHDPSLLLAAEHATAFVLERLFDQGRGRLLRRWCDGEASIPGKAADYACMTQALIDLYETSFETRYLRTAVKLTETQIELFYDRSQGGFFSTASDDTLVPLRLKDGEDGAEPSANSISAMNLLRLAAMTGRKEWRELAWSTFRHFSGMLGQAPAACPLMLAALDMALLPPVQVVLAGDPEDTRLKALHQAAFRHDRIGLVLMQASGAPPELMPDAAVIANTGEKPAAAFVCIEGSCRPPVHDPETLATLLEKRLEN